MADRTNRRTKEIFREWLEKLQQESWQLELLISGLALFGIWESRQLLGQFDDYLALNATGALESGLKSFSYFLRVSWTIFFVNLLVHIIVRGLWIGAIGLRYVSGDIDYDELGYAERFDRFLKRKVGDFDDYIERLERLSSIIFSFTFLLLFFFMSILSILLVLVLMAQITDKMYPDVDQPPAWVMAAFMILILISLMVFIDFISFGSLKKIESPIFSRVYFWIYRFVGFISLSFLYRPLLYNFIDDRYTKRLVIIAIPYILLISIVFPTFGFDAYNYVPSFSSNAAYENQIAARSFKYIYYDDLREQHARRVFGEGRNPIIDWVSLDAYEYRDQSLAKIFFHSSPNENRIFEQKFPHLVPFTDKGFHFLFNSNDRKNENIDSLKKDESSEIKFMAKVVRGQLDKITDQERNKFGDKLDYYKTHDETYYDGLKSDLRHEYRNLRLDYYKNYLDEMIEAKKSLITMKIDGEEMSDTLDCAFFTHPNMGERGILCYFPISEYTSGKHEVSISIENGSYNGKDTWKEFKRFPFVINRKIK